jgi:hypothetical protein
MMTSSLLQRHILTFPLLDDDFEPLRQTNFLLRLGTAVSNELGLL